MAKRGRKPHRLSDRPQAGPSSCGTNTTLAPNSRQAHQHHTAVSKVPVGSDARRRKISHFIAVGIALIVLVFGVYTRALQNDFVNFDDNVYVTENEVVKKGLTKETFAWAFNNRYRSNWHPLTWLSHMLDCTIFGLDPRGHHLTNVILHVANTLLVFGVLCYVTGGMWQSAFVAALFGVHPLHVESVAWVAERKDVLGAFFWLLTTAAYAVYVRRRSRIAYIVALFLFACGLMAKPMLVSLPCTLILLDFWPLDRSEFLRRSTAQSRIEPRLLITDMLSFIREKIPFILFSVAICVVTVIYQKSGGAVATTNTFTLQDRIGNALVSYVVYLKQTFWPVGLAAFYPHPRDSLGLFRITAAAVFLVTFTAWTLRCYRRPFLAVGWFWYLVVLIPVIGLVQVGEQAHADRYTYLPHIGLFAMVSWAIAIVVDGRKTATRTAVAGGVACLTVLAVLTWRQIGHWKNNATLYSRALAVTGENAVAHNNLGKAIEQNDLDQAIYHFSEAVRIKPTSPGGRNNLAAALFQKGDVDKAIEHFEISLRYRPNQERILNYLAVALDRKGQTDEAVAHYHRVLKRNPKNRIALNNLGLIHRRNQQYDDAVNCFQRLLAVEGTAQSHYRVGEIYDRMGNDENAIQHYKKALTLKPDYEQASRKLKKLQREQ